MQTLGPHVAALGVQVYNGTMFPKQYDRSLFVAEHGSWRLKRKDDIGHRVRSGLCVWKPTGGFWCQLLSAVLLVHKRAQTTKLL